MSTRRIPTGKLSRSAVTAVSAAKIGAKHAKYLGTNLLTKADAKKEKKVQHEESLGKELIKALSLLKGTALKVAQLLSMEAEIFPESIRKELAKACSQVIPLNRAVVHRAFKKEFQTGPHNVFEEFEDNAFAAASLGQVHRGRIGAGSVAIKVQYPGVANTISNDMALMRSFTGQLLKYAGFEVKKSFLTQVLDEIEDRLHDEVDYEHEAKQLNTFKKNNTQPNIRIPVCYEEYSTDRILCMEMLEGLHLGEWLKTNPSQKERDYFGQLLLDFFFHSAFTLHHLHADPHPGNYLFCDNGELGILDFGCTKKLSKEFPDKIANLLDIVIKDNSGDYDKDLIDAHIDMGMFPADTTLESYRCNLKPAMQIIQQWFSIPWEQETYDFADLPACTYYNSLDVGNSMQHFQGLHRDQIYFDRSFMGVLLMLKEMKARVKTKNPWFGIGRK